ncbi:hypothetical protein EZJ19_09025 [Parasulfuritortus cantonensis]|uniref:Uncharacterized protein n=1 Tax=Parasulfuritortus cantonensis TaxID=2528202 RepID=A0A4R1BCE2_9PROT|nr:hypothetical protein [Parasulfuritortus cantonensis]TCJ14715.1 hypothetical protein EZJ19_09025 [Parasulfuritortus cantonensis]
MAEALLDLGEIGIDSLSESGVLREVPILKTALALGIAVGSVRDYFFAKKLLGFLRAYAAWTAEERAHLIARLDQDDEFGTRLGERLMDLLARLDDERKPELIAKAMRLYAQGTISAEQLQRVHHAIDRLLLCDLGKLEPFCRADDETRITDGDPAYANFIAAGLAYVSSGWDGGGVHPTETAPLLLAAMACR